MQLDTSVRVEGIVSWEQEAIRVEAITRGFSSSEDAPVTTSFLLLLVRHLLLLAMHLLLLASLLLLVRHLLLLAMHLLLLGSKRANRTS